MNVFARSAHFLDEYIDVMEACGYSENGSTEWDIAALNDMAEMRILSARLKELDGEWETKVAVSPSCSAAEIIANMLLDWQLPGVVWYAPSKKRFRLVGDEYRPENGDICVGVYLPGASAELLEPDFATMMLP